MDGVLEFAKPHKKQKRPPSGPQNEGPLPHTLPAGPGDKADRFMPGALHQTRPAGGGEKTFPETRKGKVSQRGCSLSLPEALIRRPLGLH